MTVRSGVLDLTLSAHLMSDGSRSHCCERVCWAFHSYNYGHAVPECSHVHAQHFQSTRARNVFQHEIVTLYHWESAVFDDALCSFVWFPLVLCL